MEKAKQKLQRWQKRSQFAHYTNETLDQYDFDELYNATKSSLAIDDFKTSEHILIYLLAQKEARLKEDLHQLLGEIYYHYGNLSKAKLVCQQGLRMFPDFYGGYYLLGKVLKDSHEYSSALAALQKAISIDPDREDAYLLAKQIYQKQHKDNDALALIDRGLNHQPKSLELLKAKLDLLQQKHETGSVIKLAEMILVNHPHEKAVQKLHNIMYKKQKKLDRK